MTDMVVGFPFAPKQYRANYVCLEMRGGSFFSSLLSVNPSCRIEFH